MAKILNLDGFAAKAEARKLIIGGKEYAVEDMTVENFIETTKAADRLTGETSVAVQVEATMDMIQRSVPTVERELLQRLTLEQLQAITAFVRGENVDEAQDEAVATAEGEAGN